jgi:hypothetical protein
LAAQLIGPGDLKRAIGRHILPAIGERTQEISGSGFLANKAPGLEHVRAATSAVGDTKACSCTAKGKSGQRVRCRPIVGSHRHAADTRDRVV